MSLSGRLEDLQLRDLLQILHASSNSGLLQLQSGDDRAELLFKDGLVVSAWRQAPKQSSMQPKKIPSLLRQAVSDHVAELLDWQKGGFTFQSGPLAEMVEQFTIGEHHILEGGLGVDELLYDKPASLPAADNDDTSEHVAGYSDVASRLCTADQAGEALAALVVDDDARITAGLVAALADQGLKAQSFTTGKELLDAARCCWDAGQQPLLLIDLIMPRLHGGGLLGGLELVEQVCRLHSDARCLVYSDFSCPEVEQHLQVLGVGELLVKPRPLVYGANGRCPELDNFCQKLALQAASLLGEGEVAVDVGSQDADSAVGSPAWPNATSSGSSSGAGLGLLKSMLQELQATESADQIMLLVLRFATEVLGRAVLFSVGKERIVGLGQFGHGDGKVSADEKVRRIVVPVGEASTLSEAVERSVDCCGPLGEGRWDAYLRQQLGLERGDEVFVGPLSIGGRAVALLCGDNRPAGVTPFDRQMLAIFLQQAGAALENLQLNDNLNNLSALLGKTFS